MMDFEQTADAIIDLAQSGKGIREALIAALRQSSGRDEVQEAIEASERWEWAIVEIFGHRRHAGRTREEERFGARLLRVDVPNKGDPAAHGWSTHYYGGSSIFSFSPAEKTTCLKINVPYEAASRLALEGPDSEMPF